MTATKTTKVSSTTSTSTTNICVNVFVKRDGDNIPILTVTQAALLRISRTARPALRSQRRSPKQVIFTGCAPAAVRYVLDEMLKKRTNNHVTVNIKDKTFDHVVAMLEAVNTLQLEPPQPHIEGFVVYHLAHKKIQPSNLRVVHQAFGYLGHASKAWRVMVHQIAWDSLNLDKAIHTEANLSDLAAEIAKHPALEVAIEQKYYELDQRKRNAQDVAAAKKEFWAAKKRAQEAQKAAKVKRVEAAKARDARLEADRRANEAYEKRKWEEKVGLRPVSKDTLDFINNRAVFWMGRKKRDVKAAAKRAEEERARAADTTNAANAATAANYEAKDEDEGGAEEGGDVEVNEGKGGAKELSGEASDANELVGEEH